MGDREVIMSQNASCRQRSGGQIPTKLQIDPTGNHGVMPLGHYPGTRLGHNIIC
jgi:hypothetical protein